MKVTLPTTGTIWTTVAEYVPKHTEPAEDFLDHDCDPDFCEVDENGTEWVPEGWYEATIESDYMMIIGGKVEWWMPIPAAPDAAERGEK